MASVSYQLVVVLLLIAACGGVCSAYSGDAAALLDELQIKKLSICYAYGVDAVGNGGSAAAAVKIWRPCFVENATFIVDGTSFYGIDTYSVFVENVFRTSKYSGTQHMIGSQSVTFVGKGKAEQTSYLIATHVNPDRTINFYNGFYTDVVVQKKGVWKIESRSLKTLSFLKLTGMPVGI